MLGPLNRTFTNTTNIWKVEKLHVLVTVDFLALIQHKEIKLQVLEIPLWR